MEGQSKRLDNNKLSLRYFFFFLKRASKDFPQVTFAYYSRHLEFELGEMFQKLEVTKSLNTLNFFSLSFYLKFKITFLFSYRI